MDENHEFDTVKAEKANAIANFRRVRNVAKMIRLLETFVALALISYSSTRLPSAVKLYREYLIVFSGYLFNPHVVFVIGNAIVLALYVLSRNVDGTVESGSASASAVDNVSDDNHNCRTTDHNVAAVTAVADIFSEKYHKCSKTDHHAVAETEATISENELSPLPAKSVAEERIADDRQIVCFENTVTITKTESKEEEAAAAIVTAKKQITRFQRTQSEKLKREISMKPQKDYRRSETEIRRLDGRRTLTTSFDAVDRLSNEEFRLRVESFIEKQQSFLKSQKLAEDFK